MPLLHNYDFTLYLVKLELEFIEKGVQAGTLGQMELVPTREGRLTRTRFGSSVRGVIPSDHIFTIDYYGLYKKTSGALAQILSVSLETGRQIKAIEMPVVHFASIRIEDIAENAQHLVAEFPRFKQNILKLRGFK